MQPRGVAAQKARRMGSPRLCDHAEFRLTDAHKKMGFVLLDPDITRHFYTDIQRADGITISKMPA